MEVLHQKFLPLRSPELLRFALGGDGRIHGALWLDYRLRGCADEAVGFRELPELLLMQSVLEIPIEFHNVDSGHLGFAVRVEVVGDDEELPEGVGLPLGEVFEGVEEDRVERTQLPAVQRHKLLCEVLADVLFDFAEDVGDHAVGDHFVAVGRAA